LGHFAPHNRQIIAGAATCARRLTVSVPRGALNLPVVGGCAKSDRSRPALGRPTNERTCPPRVNDFVQNPRFFPRQIHTRLRAD
jgi:hypothetical protein